TNISDAHFGLLFCIHVECGAGPIACILHQRAAPYGPMPRLGGATIDQNRHRAADSADRAISATAPSTEPVIIGLPVPPSVNRLWRGTGKTVIRSGDYTSWLREAGALTLASAQLRGVRMIAGPFAAEIVVQRSRADLDNQVKRLLD